MRRAGACLQSSCLETGSERFFSAMIQSCRNTKFLYASFPRFTHARSCFIEVPELRLCAERG